MSALPLLAIAAAATLMLLSTLLNKYLFMDETWYIQPYSPLDWTQFGRPLLNYIMWATEYVEDRLGLNAIYIYRVAGVILLATTGYLVFLWVRRFSYQRFEATWFSIGLMSLPAFQVIVATSVQLTFATVAATLATLLIAPLLTGRSSIGAGIWRVSIASLLCLVALCIYQVGFLMTFALLLLPMLQTRRHDIRRHLAIGATYVWLVVIAVVYYLAWQLVYVAPEGGENALYNPNAASFSTLIANLAPFFEERFTQTANLWYVEDFSTSIFFYASVAVVAAGAIRLLWTEPLHALLKIVVAVATLPMCDLFRLASGKVPTYTTLHSLSTAWWLLFICSVQLILGQSRAIYQQVMVFTVAMIGVVSATWTTTAYITARNAAEFSAVEQSMLADPEAKKIHIFGVLPHYSQLFEYAYTSGQLANYLGQMTVLLTAVYLHRNPLLDITHVAMTEDEYLNNFDKPDLAIRLPEFGYHCAGAGCRLTDEQIDRFDWSVVGTPQGIVAVP